MEQSLTIPEIRPIKIGCFTLTEDGLDVRGKPSFGEYQGVGLFIRRAHKAAGWWLADWLAYADLRPDWKEQVDNLLDAEVLNEGTVKQYKYIRAKFPKEKRVEGVSFGHHAIVARVDLDDEERHALLEQSKLEGWTQHELRQEARAKKRARIISGQAALEGMFRVIYADCPWLYGDSGVPDSGALGKAARHYEGMATKALCELPVAAHALPDSVLWSWSTASMLPDALAVGTAWGFTYKTCMVWDKVLHNYGHYVGVHHELLLIFTRGSCLPDAPTPMPDSVQTIRRAGEHSAKPEEFRKIITKLYTRGPYLELFARKRVEGWSCFGNDARLWAEDMRATA